MEKMVEANRLGKKTGEGFFQWDDETCQRPTPDDPHDATPILAALVNEAHRLVDDGVGDEAPVSEVLKRGADSNVGPFDLADIFARESLRVTLEARYEKTGVGVYEPVF
jgi:enoyl-CoA hydratase/3-hydroxyacyl-CoA dehydrogenase